MDIMNLMKERHSVRSYTDKRIEESIRKELLECISDCNQESGLHIQACFDEPKAFDSLMAHYGKFENVRNYIAIVGKKSKNIEEMSGYYGEKVVLKAQELGLNTCWVAMTYSKGKSECRIDKGEKLYLVIALGYGKTQGVPHKTKEITQLYKVEGSMPEWFKRGMEAASLAPTAVNQQKFLISLENGKVEAKALMGFYTKIDLGIVKYHFECGAGKENFKWK